jgi:hypothetical protein
MKLFKMKHLMLMLALTIGMTSMMTSCSDDDDSDEPVQVDKETLASKLDEANDLINNTEEGTAEGQYQRGAKAELQSVIDNAQAVYDDDEATQSEVDNTVVALSNAIDTYLSKEITPIAPEAMVGHWTFDDGSGTSVSDYSENGHDGTLYEAPDGWNGGMPQWETDRYGDDAKSLFFNEGSHVKIPYNPALNPGQMSITLWIKASEVLENNRFIGLHSWNAYKFQLQSANKAFFTAATTEGIYDKDTDPPLELDQWYHIGVTVGDGNMTFYVNGTQTQKWDDVPGAMQSESTNDLVFGVDSDEYADNADNYDEDQIIPLAWGGFFHGYMDEVRMYNTILTESQVSSIYELEKVTEE